MYKFIKKYWPEIFVFAVFALVYLIDLSPDKTWLMCDSDGPEYVMDAKYFYPAHHTSAPLYLLLGHLFLMIPYGMDYWKMSLMSGVFTVGTLIFVYLTVRYLLEYDYRVRFFAILAASIFGAAALVIGQAVIVETYAVVTFFSVGAYYFVVKKKWYWAAAFVGMGIVTHHLMLLTYFVFLLAFKEMRNWKRITTVVAFLIFYLYMPLSIRFTDQPNMWGNTGFKDFFTNNIAVFTMLVGQIAIYDFPKRILDTIGVLGISLGLGLIFVGWYIWSIRKQSKWWKNPLLWLFVLPVIYPMTDLAPQVAKYSEASIAWGAIITVLLLAKVKMRYAYAMCLSVAILLPINANYFDIGRTMDKGLAATKFYNEELAKIPDGDIFVTMPAWEWIETYLYNKENGRKIIPVCVGTLASEQYQDRLRAQGVYVESISPELQPGGDNKSHDLNEKQVKVAMSIINGNSNVWVSRPTDPSVYGAEVVPAKGNEYQITRWLGEASVEPQWQWKPSNPYDTISGSIEVESWIFILQSNRSVLFFVEWATFGIFAYYVFYRITNKKKKRKEVSSDIGSTLSA